MGESVNTAGVWIRPEDADQPKLERLRRVVTVSIGPDADVAVPWLVWGNGLPRSWLFGKLELGAQVLILPPWPESGFAGLPAVRTEVGPASHLSLQNNNYAVGATCAMERSAMWQLKSALSQAKVQRMSRPVTLTKTALPISTSLHPVPTRLATLRSAMGKSTFM